MPIARVMNWNVELLGVEPIVETQQGGGNLNGSQNQAHLMGQAGTGCIPLDLPRQPASGSGGGWRMSIPNSMPPLGAPGPFDMGEFNMSDPKEEPPPVEEPKEEEPKEEESPEEEDIEDARPRIAGAADSPAGKRDDPRHGGTAAARRNRTPR